MKFLLLTLLSVSFSLTAFGKPGDCKILIEQAIDAAIEVQYLETTIQNYRDLNKSDLLSDKIDENLKNAKNELHSAKWMTAKYCKD